jgi:branched-chain amino acid transport system permease protein
MAEGALPRLAALAGTALLVAVPPTLGSYPLFLLCAFLISAIGAVGLNLVMGYAGLVSLGHAGFAAIGAYTTALLILALGLSYWPALAVGGLAAGAAGWLIGVPSLRLSPLYLAMVTFSFGEIVVLIALNWLPVTRGPNGIRIPPPSLGGVALDLLPFYYALLVVTVACLLAARNLVASKPGRAFMAIRDSAVAAQAAGIHLAAYKTTAFALSALYAGLAGGLYLGVARFITPESFVFGVSLTYVTMNVVGGMGSLLGAVVGAGVFTLVPELLRGFTKYRELIAGALLLAGLLFMPLGVVGLLTRRRAAPGPVDDEPPAARRTRAPVEAGADSPRPAARLAPDPMQPTPLLVASGVSIRFGGVTALDGVSLTVASGEIRALIGPNGSGKTTLLNVLTRIYRPDAGTVTYDGRDLLRCPPHALAALGVARTFQNLELFARMTVLDNVLVGLHASLAATLAASGLAVGRARREERRARDEAHEILRTLGLARWADAPAGSLAFGHQRTLGIARALAARPRLLLLDEPGAGLTVAELDELGATLAEIRARSGAAILLVAHTMPLVMEVSDAVSVLDHGTLIAEGSPAAVAGDPKVIEAYLGSPDAGAALLD